MLSYILKNNFKRMWKGADHTVGLEWHSSKIPLSNIITRNFCLPKALPHYSFCEAFFLDGSIDSLKKSRYAHWLPLRHTDYFINYPKNLTRKPIWWELPWGGYNKIDETIDLKILQKQRYQAANAYIKVLQSIRRTGFSFSRGPTTPVQLLVDGENYVCIQQGSHHRLAALDFLVTNQFDDLTTTIENENGDPLVPCEITLILNREDLECLDQVGNLDGQFSKNDAYLWFDLALSLIGKEGVNRITEEDIILNSISQIL